MNDGTWYRAGTVSLTNGSDLVNGVGTAFIDNVFAGGIFFSPVGLHEVTRVISDTQLQLVTAYAGATVAGAPFAVAPTQGAVVVATKQLQTFLTTLGPLKQAWDAGDLNAKGLVLKGVKPTEAELPTSGNVQGDGWLVDGTLFVWTGTSWSDQGKLTVTPELEALRDEILSAKESTQAIAAEFGDVAGVLGVAIGQADRSEDEADRSGTARVGAEAAQTATQVLRDQVMAAGNARPSVPIALADGTIANGATFSAPLADGSLQAYTKNSSASATAFGDPFATQALLLAVKAIVSDDEYDSDYEWAVLGSADDVGLGLLNDGTIDLGFAMLTFGDEYEGYGLVVVDAQGGLIFAGQEGADNGAAVASLVSQVAAAQGTQSSLAARLAPVLRPDGLPIGDFFGASNLFETRRILGALSAPIAGDGTVQLVAATIGDSWMDDRSYGLKRLVKALKAKYGNAGVGAVGFAVAPTSDGPADDDEATVAINGAWTGVAFTSPSPNLRQITSSTTGDRVTLSVASAGAPASAVALLYLGGAGTVQYRYNSGSWTSLALDGAGAQRRVLSAPPAGAFTLDIDVVTGPCTLYLLDVRKATAGICWHKLGASSSAAIQWSSVDATIWRQNIANLGINLAHIHLGTNDAHQYNAAAFRGYQSIIFDNVRAAAPLADIMFTSPPRNLSTNATWSITDHTYALRSLAAERGAAHLDLQYAFGAVPADYGPAGRVYIAATDLYHPSKPKGAQVITAAIFKTLTGAIQ